MVIKYTLLFLLWTLAQLPFALCHYVGRGLGWLLWRLDRRGRQVALINLTRCYPFWDEAQHQSVARHSFFQAGQTLAESAYIWQNPPAKTLSRVVAVEGQAELETALKERNGAIVAGPHLGNWEVLGLYLGQHFPSIAMFRPPNQAFLTDLMQKGRQASGSVLVPANQSGVRQMVRHLKKQHGVAGILPDQDPASGEGAFAPFFGVQTYTMTLVSRLASRLDLPVFLGYAERLASGQFKIHFIRLDEQVADKNIEVALTTLNSAIEAEIRRLPEQYLWMYKRFKSRPAGEARFYP